jgi:isopenicillin N synthase-like dioxygenase
MQAWERTINGTDVKDNMELVNLPKYIKEYDDTPRHAIFKEHERVIADFHRRCWYDVARKLFVLFALVLELPENYFVERHDYELPSQDHLRYVSRRPGVLSLALTTDDVPPPVQGGGCQVQ